MDHHPHRHPHPALLHRGRKRRHSGDPGGTAGAGAQRAAAGTDRLLRLRHPFGTGRHPQCGVSGAGSAGSAGGPPRTGRERRLLRLPVRHRCGTGTADHHGRAVRAGHRLRGAVPAHGPGRPLHLRALWRRRRSGGVPAGSGDHPLCFDAGGHGAMPPSTPGDQAAQALPPSPWTAGRCSALRWRRCPGA